MYPHTAVHDDAKQVAAVMADVPSATSAEIARPRQEHPWLNYRVSYIPLLREDMHTFQDRGTIHLSPSATLQESSCVQPSPSMPRCLRAGDGSKGMAREIVHVLAEFETTLIDPGAATAYAGAGTGRSLYAAVFLGKHGPN